MSSEQSIPTSDLRGAAQDYKRDATRKHKWALGSVAPHGREDSHPRPQRPHETFRNSERRYGRDHVTDGPSGKTKLARKQDMLAAGDEYPTLNQSDESSTSADEDHDIAANIPAGEEIMYSFDAARGPNHGSQILNVALAKAIEKYEDKETVKLVRKEYEMIDDDEGDSLGLSPVKKSKDKERIIIPAEDEEYEFI